MLKRLRRRVRNFFFPPPGSSRLRRILPFATLFAIPVVCTIAAVPAWGYSNSPEFCGKTCHTMPPEYQTYLVSPHARVLCVDCHIGRGSFFEQLYRKSGHSMLLYKTVAGAYEFPIRASSMRPARETCELCHFPEKFSDDSLRVVQRFEANENNSPYAIYLLMHTGGGSRREGLGRGIHWHIENKIEFIATDPEEQNIPWVRVRTPDGEETIYVSVDSTIDEANLSQYTLQEMDCITCHNRISHLILDPARVVDQALYQGDLSTDIPFIRERAIEALSQQYESEDEARAAFAELEDYYKVNYPDYYAENQDTVQEAVRLLEQLYDENNYPEQELNWKTHPNNIGHRDSPGCFRCHDGKHFSSEGEAIRLECNLCHSIPQIVRPSDVEPMMPLTTGIEPTSHLSTTWIHQHSQDFNETCSNCHTTRDVGGTTNISFCSNGACHGVEWKYASFDVTRPVVLDSEAAEATPGVAEGETVTYTAIFPILELNCSRCHGDAAMAGLRLTRYDTLMEGSFNGPVVVPGEPDNSRIITILAEGHFASLTDDEINLLRRWIEAGVPEGDPLATPFGE